MIHYSQKNKYIFPTIKKKSTDRNIFIQRIISAQIFLDT